MLRTRLLGAAAILALSTGLAVAAPAALERSGNVRAGPGTNYPVIATLPAGTVVDVEGCPGSWCSVDTSAGSGFIARSLLALGGGGPAVAVAPGGYYDYDDYYDDSYAYGPGVGVYVAPGHRHWRHRHGWRGRDGGNWAGRPDIRDGRGNWTGGRGGSGSVSIPAKRQPGVSANFGARSTVGVGAGGGRSTVGAGSVGGRGSVGGGAAIGGGGRGGFSGGGAASSGGGGGSAPAKAIPGR